MNAVVRALRSLMRRRRSERAMQDEFRFHLDMEADDLARAGLPRHEARRRAALAFGGAEAYKDAAREARRWSWLDDVGRDARYACRQLRRAPGFAAVVVATLAVGVAATSTIFSIVNGVLLRPLPYEDPGRLVAVAGLSYKGEFVQLRDHARTLAVGGYGVPRQVSLTGSGDPVRLTAVPATPEMFAVLGVAAEHGRTFAADEGRAGATPAIVLSHAAWRRMFGGDAGIVGRPLTIDGVARTVVGVMPPAFTFPQRGVDAWMPLVVREGDPIDLWAQSAAMVGRLRDGAAIGEARAEIAARVPGFRSMFPWKMPADYGVDATVIPLQEKVVGDVRRALLVLLAAVAAVLAIVCVNVANLMLARGMSRQREMAIRAAIGAGRMRLFRQMLAESLTLALIAGGLGLLLSYWSLGAVTARLPVDMPRVDEIVLDTRVMVFTCVVSLLAGLVFGLWPALRIASARIEPALREAGRSAGMAPGSRRMAQGLVVAEIALAVVLVTAAALLVQSFRNLTAVDPGFRAERLVAATIAPPAFRYKDAGARLAFIENLLERLRGHEGVIAASAATAMPLGAPAFGAVFAIEGRPDPATQSGEWPLADVTAEVDSRYFATMAMQVVAGREFTAADRTGAPAVAVVSRSLAASYWGAEDPVGARVRFPGSREWVTII
jgi:predicted permease